MIIFCNFSGHNSRRKESHARTSNETTNTHKQTETDTGTDPDVHAHTKQATNHVFPWWVPTARKGSSVFPYKDPWTASLSGRLPKPCRASLWALALRLLPSDGMSCLAHGSGCRSAGFPMLVPVLLLTFPAPATQHH